MKKGGITMKLCLFFVASALALLAALPVHAQGGFIDDTEESAKIVTIEYAQTLPDDASVQLQGSIVRALGDEKYLFRDPSGEIVVEIDDDVWRGVTVRPSDWVEIRGEVDKEEGSSAKIEVGAIRNTRTREPEWRRGRAWRHSHSYSAPEGRWGRDYGGPCCWGYRW
jgi:uncharacterized protein (TIGR00156 family)